MSTTRPTTGAAVPSTTGTGGGASTAGGGPLAVPPGRPWSERAFLLTFVFGFGALWCLAGAGVLYQVRVANYMIWFYALGAGLINAISHFVFPIIKGGYFPGLYTATGHLALSILLIHLLLQESRRLRAEAAATPG